MCAPGRATLDVMLCDLRTSGSLAPGGHTGPPLHRRFQYGIYETATNRIRQQHHRIRMIRVGALFYCALGAGEPEFVSSTPTIVRS